VNHLYSREFIELAAGHLKPGGIMAHWIPLMGSGGGVDDSLTLWSLVHTFAQVFPHTYVHASMDGVGLHVLGSMSPIDFDAAWIEGRMRDGVSAADLNEWHGPTPGWVRNDWHLAAAVLQGRQVRVVSDDRPLLEFYLWRTLLGSGMKSPPDVRW
jgi:hypothetical protein